MIYITVKNKFEEQLRTLPAVKSVDWFNEQYLNTDKDEVEPYPAIYIEIVDPVEWGTAGDKMQHGKMRVKLHVVIDTLKPTPEPLMLLTQDVFLLINDQAFNNGDAEITSRWQRINSSVVKRYRKLKVMTTTFEAEVYDFTPMDELTPAENITFNING